MKIFFCIYVNIKTAISLSHTKSVKWGRRVWNEPDERVKGRRAIFVYMCKRNFVSGGKPEESPEL